jgi:hypothetical protein
MSSSPIGETLVLLALMSTFNLLLDVGLEWRNQPRQLRYWTDGSPPGIVIRHVGTGEILLHTENTVIQSTDLQGICLEGADLRALTLPQAALRGARLQGANLEAARLDEGCFEDADLTGCRLGGAWLRRASFKRADLRGADFRGSGAVSALTAGRLDGANFFGAHYNAATRWPRGFDPAAHGCAYENDAEQALPIPAQRDNSSTQTLPIASGACRPDVSQCFRATSEQNTVPLGREDRP